MLIASEPTPPGGDAGPVTNENVPVLLVGSNAHGPFGAMSPLPTTVVVVAAAAVLRSGRRVPRPRGKRSPRRRLPAATTAAARGRKKRARSARSKKTIHDVPPLTAPVLQRRR